MRHVPIDKLQIYVMQQYYPQFKAKQKDIFDIEFVGVLFVKPGIEYKVSINYRGNNSPFVRVLEPKLVENAPHIYKETRTLCLYHPDLFKWKREKLIAKEIVGLVAGWLYFYEVWLQEGVWYGPEVPHGTQQEK